MTSCVGRIGTIASPIVSEALFDTDATKSLFGEIIKMQHYDASDFAMLYVLHRLFMIESVTNILLGGSVSAIQN